MDKRAVFCAGWAGAMQATDLSSLEELEQTYIRWLEKEDEGVDPLALMLDGVETNPEVAGGWFRFDEDNVDALARYKEHSKLATYLRKPGIEEVAQAIFELEAWADWQPIEGKLSGPPMPLGDMAYVMLKGSMESLGRRAPCQTIDYLEAAARLRDGWRPQ